MIHNLKIQERFYKKIVSWIKTFEIRMNDRDYKVWDTITFKIVNENAELLRFWDIELKITDVFQEEWYWLSKWVCILSFKLINIWKK